jgi:hypothetical protein
VKGVDLNNSFFERMNIFFCLKLKSAEQIAHSNIFLGFLLFLFLLRFGLGSFLLLLLLGRSRGR